MAVVYPDLTYVRPAQKGTQCGDRLVEILNAALSQPESLPPPRLERIPGANAFIVYDALPGPMCDQLVAAVEELGFSFWNLAAPEKRDFRNAETVEVNCVPLADFVWQRVKAFAELVITYEAEDEGSCERGMEGEWRAKGISEDLLFVRYLDGGHFSPHTDGFTVVDFNTRSLFTALVYLNDCAQGGATRLLRCQDGFHQDERGRFRWDDDRLLGEAKCVKGSVLLFFQDLPHEGEPVEPGSAKYIIRTDLVYERVPPRCDYPDGREAFKLFRQAEILESEGNHTQAAQLFRRCTKLCPELAKMLGI